MNGALLVILALLWALMLLPGAIRSRRSSLRASVGGFHRAMESLREQPRGGRGRVSGRAVMVPGEPDRLAQRAADGRSRRGQVGRAILTRRRRVFAGLVGTTAIMLVLALVSGGLGWLLFGLSSITLGGYCVLLRRWKLERDQARRVVHDLTARRGPPPADPEGSGAAAGHPRAAPEPAQAVGGPASAPFGATRQAFGHRGNVRLRPSQPVV